MLEAIPELQAHKQGRDVLLVLQEDVGLALFQAVEYSETLIMAKAPKILRRHILDHKSRFDGTFHEGCIKDAIPSVLLQFIGIVEHGADIKSQLRFGTSKSDQAQLLQYNCYSSFKEGAATHRHPKDRETAFPVYIDKTTVKKSLVTNNREWEMLLPPVHFCCKNIKLQKNKKIKKIPCDC